MMALSYSVFAKDMSWLPQIKRRQHHRMELEAVTVLQLLCKQPPAGKEHSRDSSARVPPSHLTSNHQSYLRFTRIVSLPHIKLIISVIFKLCYAVPRGILFLWEITELVQSNSEGPATTSSWALHFLIKAALLTKKSVSQQCGPVKTVSVTIPLHIQLSAQGLGFRWKYLVYNCFSLPSLHSPQSEISKKLLGILMKTLDHCKAGTACSLVPGTVEEQSNTAIICLGPKHDLLIFTEFSKSNKLLWIRIFLNTILRLLFTHPQNHINLTLLYLFLDSIVGNSYQACISLKDAQIPGSVWQG